MSFKINVILYFIQKEMFACLLGFPAFIVFFIVLCYPSFVNAVIPAEERDALIALYNSSGGAAWVNNEGWLGAAGTECTWFGISCAQDNNVRSLSLKENSLVGTIPKELANLSELRTLLLQEMTRLYIRVKPELAQQDLNIQIVDTPKRKWLQRYLNHKK